MPQKVLMVDDEPLMHLLYKTHLEKAGYQMLAAKDGTEVLELATREQPAVIVMDILMAQMDGLAALRALKKNEATKTIPVIIITAHVSAHHAVRQEAQSAGATLFLSKPFSPSHLLGALQQVLPAAGTPGASAAPQQ
jgi:CheY-like chemotaxis protein